MTDIKRVHYYHADASAFGGHFERPIEHIVAPQVPMSLPPSGGYGSARSENFRIEGLVSYKSAFTQVAGFLSKKPDHGWVTLVTAVVEGFNFLDVVTADRLTAQISTEHPLKGDNPKVNFLGTSFENLRIAGYPVHVTLNLNICDQNGNNYPDPDIPCVSDKRFLERVAAQYRLITDPERVPEWADERGIPQWVRDRYTWNEEKTRKSGSVLCSVVEGIAGEFPGTPYGNVFEIPEFGRVFLGEVLVDCKSYRLTMVRIETGCSSESNTSAATANANGHTIPP
jgi:hypothetical protein